MGRPAQRRDGVVAVPVHGAGVREKNIVFSPLTYIAQQCIYRPRTVMFYVMLSKELVAASAEPLILSLLSGGESYGYAIIQEVKKLSGEEMQWTDGMLYPVL